MLMANIIKILLFRGEMSLACYLTAFYSISIDKDMFNMAIEKKQLTWLNYVYAFQKNFIGDKSQVDSKTGKTKAQEVMLRDLFKMLIQHYEKQRGGQELAKQQIYECCNWKLKTKENILEALLYHMLDQVCLDFMGTYSQFLQDEDLFLFSLNHNNNVFVK